MYAVTFDCPHCGKVHVVTAGLVLDHGPDHRGTAADLWPGGDLPAVLAALLRDRIWCDDLGTYVGLDLERVIVTPPGGFA